VKGIFPTGKTGDPMAFSDQALDQGHSDKASATGNQDFHNKWLYL
jgi:hypothetical protein